MVQGVKNESVQEKKQKRGIKARIMAAVGRIRVKRTAFIAILAILLFLLLYCESFVFMTHVIPYVSALTASYWGITEETNWIYAAIFWGFPTLFFVLLTSAFHIWFIGKVCKKFFRWAKNKITTSKERSK